MIELADLRARLGGPAWLGDLRDRRERVAADPRQAELARGDAEVPVCGREPRVELDGAICVIECGLELVRGERECGAIALASRVGRQLGGQRPGARQIARRDERGEQLAAIAVLLELREGPQRDRLAGTVAARHTVRPVRRESLAGESRLDRAFAWQLERDLRSLGDRPRPHHERHRRRRNQPADHGHAAQPAPRCHVRGGRRRCMRRRCGHRVEHDRIAEHRLTLGAARQVFERGGLLGLGQRAVEVGGRPREVLALSHRRAPSSAAP